VYSLIFGAMTAIGVAAGPIIGGLLATYASWRWAFCLGAVVVIFPLLKDIGSIYSFSNK
jgi:MFS family permease